MKLFVTFNIGGPLRGYYMELEAESGNHIRQFAGDHFPKDWAGTYDEEEFLPQIEKYGLRLLCSGAIEYFNGRYHFHEGKTLEQVS